MATYTFLGIGAQPPELCVLAIPSGEGDLNRVYRPGDSVVISEEQHVFLRNEGHIFAEDIVQSPGG